jgi:hypothetical protein
MTQKKKKSSMTKKIPERRERERERKKRIRRR